ncbi:MAG: universal stress protein [Dehalococcoidales bacterium]
MYKRILVPLDGSELAEKSLPYAEELAPLLGAEVVILNVRMPSEDPDKPEHRAYISKITATTEEKVLKSPHLKRGEKIKVMSAIIGSTGPVKHPAEQIVDYAEKESISLIIIASHGRSGISRWALGSTANKVASVSKCPVLLVRAGASLPRPSHLEKMLVTLDGSKQAEAVLSHIEWLVPRLKAKVTLLTVVETLYHIYPAAETIGYFGGAGVIKIPYTEEEMKPSVETAEKYIKEVNQKLASEGITTGYEIRVGAAGQEIIAAEKETGADMVIMSTYGHSGFGRWDHGSIADKVMHGGSVPLLLIRPK